MIKSLFRNWLVPELQPSTVEFILLSSSVKMPEQKLEGDAGFDVTAHTVDASHPLYVRYGLGFKMQLPKNHVGLLFPRSSVRDILYTMADCVGVIDSGYTGEVSASFRKHNAHFGNLDIAKELLAHNLITAEDLKLAIAKEASYFNTPLLDKIYKPGDRVAQLIILSYKQYYFKSVVEFSRITTRGDKGHGSTGIS